MTRLTVCALGATRVSRRPRAAGCARARARGEGRPATGCSTPTIRACSPWAAAASDGSVLADARDARARRHRGLRGAARRRRHVARAGAARGLPDRGAGPRRARPAPLAARARGGAHPRARATTALPASASPGRTGVWVAEREDRLHRRRRAPLGRLSWVRVECRTDPTRGFSLIHPCGFSGIRMTIVAGQLGDRAPVAGRGPGNGDLANWWRRLGYDGFDGGPAADGWALAGIARPRRYDPSRAPCGLPGPTTPIGGAPNMVTLTEAATRKLSRSAHAAGERRCRPAPERCGRAAVRATSTACRSPRPAEQGDWVGEFGGVKVFVDAESAPAAGGRQGGLRRDRCEAHRLHDPNPNAVRSCGCGKSFETEESAESGRRAPVTAQLRAPCAHRRCSASMRPIASRAEMRPRLERLVRAEARVRPPRDARWPCCSWPRRARRPRIPTRSSCVARARSARRLGRVDRRGRAALQRAGRAGQGSRRGPGGFLRALGRPAGVPVLAGSTSPRSSHWHTLEGGFSGRQPLKERRAGAD